jgi:hypothetical protein
MNTDIRIKAELLLLLGVIVFLLVPLTKTVIILGGALVTYLFVGFYLVASDYSLPPIQRPVYVWINSFWLDLCQILFWPIPRTALRLREKRLRRDKGRCTVALESDRQ